MQIIAGSLVGSDEGPLPVRWIVKLERFFIRLGRKGGELCHTNRPNAVIVIVLVKLFY